MVQKDFCRRLHFMRLHFKAFLLLCYSAKKRKNRGEKSRWIPQEIWNFLCFVSVRPIFILKIAGLSIKLIFDFYVKRPKSPDIQTFISSKIQQIITWSTLDVQLMCFYYGKIGNWNFNDQVKDFHSAEKTRGVNRWISTV